MQKEVERDVLVQMQIRSGVESQNEGISISCQFGCTSFLRNLIGKDGMEEVARFTEEKLEEPIKELNDLIGKLIVREFKRDVLKSSTVSKTMSDILEIIREFMEGMDKNND